MIISYIMYYQFGRNIIMKNDVHVFFFSFQFPRIGKKYPKTFINDLKCYKNYLKPKINTSQLTV